MKKIIGFINNSYNSINKKGLLWIFLIVSILIIIVNIIFDKEISFLNVFTNISISYIAAMIFYYFQTIISNKKYKEIAYQVLNPSFFKLIEMIEVTIKFVDKYIDFNNNGIKINWNGDNDEKAIYFQYTNGVNEILIPRKIKKESILKSQLDFRNLVNDIRISNFYKYLDNELIILIEKIFTIDLFYDVAILFNSEESVSDLNYLKQKIMKYSCNVEELKNLTKIHCFYKIIDIKSDSVLRKCGDFMYDLLYFCKDIKLYNKIIEDEYIRNNLINLFENSNVDPTNDNLKKAFGAIREVQKQINKE